MYKYTIYNNILTWMQFYYLKMFMNFLNQDKNVFIPFTNCSIVFSGIKIIQHVIIFVGHMNFTLFLSLSDKEMNKDNTYKYIAINFLKFWDFTLCFAKLILTISLHLCPKMPGVKQHNKITMDTWKTYVFLQRINKAQD